MILHKTNFGFKCIIYTQTQISVYLLQENEMSWNKPAATEMRFGFEVTMYVNNR